MGFVGMGSGLDWIIMDIFPNLSDSLILTAT